MSRGDARSGSGGDGDGFRRLWPTLFLERVIPDAGHANAALAALMLERDAAAEQLTTRYLDESFLDVPHPAVQWLRACVRRTVLDYLAEGVGRALDWHAHGWCNVNRRGDYHTLHNHPRSYLSGTYYVSVPEQPSLAGTRDAMGSRDDLNPGAISFFDPRAQANMTALAGDGQFDPELRRVPEAGLMLLWPAFLHHAVHPNFADEPRLSVSFNVMAREAANASVSRATSRASGSPPGSGPR